MNYVAVRSSMLGWIGLGWVCKVMGWVGLGWVTENGPTAMSGVLWDAKLDFGLYIAKRINKRSKVI